MVKKKDKKPMSWGNLLSIIAILFLVVFGIYIYSIYKVNFIIYKYECNNKTFCEGSVTKLQNQDSLLVGEIYKVYLVPSWNDTYEYWYQRCSHSKVCERVEKDYIEYPSIDYEKLGDCSKSVNGTTLTTVLTFEEDSDIKRVDVGDVNIYTEDCIDYEVYPIKTISKQDLSIEWLERKAVCHECLVEREDGESVSLDYKYCEGEIAGDYKECYKYKFNEYTIELK